MKKQDTTKLAALIRDPFWDPNTATIEVEIEQTDCEVRGNASASDDPELDREAEDAILARLDLNDVWAWCDVRVSASAGGVTCYSDWIGCCSYEGEKEFREVSGHFDELKEQAIERLARYVRGSLVVGGTGEVFTFDESRVLARLLQKRFGGSAAGASAWCRMLQNSTTEAEFVALAAHD